MRGRTLGRRSRGVRVGAADDAGDRRRVRALGQVGRGRCRRPAGRRRRPAATRRRPRRAIRSPSFVVSSTRPWTVTSRQAWASVRAPRTTSGRGHGPGPEPLDRRWRAGAARRRPPRSRRSPRSGRRRPGRPSGRAAGPRSRRVASWTTIRRPLASSRSAPAVTTPWTRTSRSVVSRALRRWSGRRCGRGRLVGRGVGRRSTRSGVGVGPGLGGAASRTRSRRVAHPQPVAVEGALARSPAGRRRRRAGSVDPTGTRRGRQPLEASAATRTGRRPRSRASNDRSPLVALVGLVDDRCR